MTIPNQLPEFQISLKTKVKPSELYPIRTGADVAKVARMCFDADSIEWHETFVIIALNQANKVLGFYKLSSGGIDMVACDPRMVFQFALLSNATSLIIAHNHPSGSLKPSREDEEMTHKIKSAGSFLSIKLLDHVIVTSEGYYSFAEEGLI